MDLLGAAYARLVTMEDALPRYAPSGGASGPNIFVEEAPEDAGYPFVIIRPPEIQEPFDTKTTRGREVGFDVAIYAARTGSTKAIDDLAELVRSAFHRAPLTGPDFAGIIQVVSGPFAGPFEDDLYSRVVSVRSTVEEG